jgi:hypothetical protein
MFGGSQGYTHVYQIDVFDDYLAMAGDTLDNSLLGLNTQYPMPYVALHSISTAAKIYWAKAFS